MKVIPLSKTNQLKKINSAKKKTLTLKEKNLRKRERKMKTKTYQKSLLKKLHKECWKLMSEWVRRKDANLDGYVECYTCDRPIHWKESDAGHFKHGRLDYDPRNIHVQCTKCNRWEHGKLDVYAERLLKKHGKKWFDQLVLDSWTKPPYTIDELKFIIFCLKEKISKLK